MILITSVMDGSLICKFYRIVKQMPEYLVKPHRISINCWCFDFGLSWMISINGLFFLAIFSMMAHSAVTGYVQDSPAKDAAADCPIQFLDVSIRSSIIFTSILLFLII